MTRFCPAAAAASIAEDGKDDDDDDDNAALDAPPEINSGSRCI